MKSPALKAIEEGQKMRSIVNQPNRAALKYLPPTNSAAVDAVIEVVAKKYEITVEQIRSASRVEYISWPRIICYWLLRRHTNLPDRRIATLLGRAHPATVCYGAQCVQGRIEVYQEVADAINALSAECDAAINRITGENV